MIITHKHIGYILTTAFVIFLTILLYRDHQTKKQLNTMMTDAASSYYSDIEKASDGNRTEESGDNIIFTNDKFGFSITFPKTLSTFMALNDFIALEGYEEPTNSSVPTDVNDVREDIDSDDITLTVIVERNRQGNSWKDWIDSERQITTNPYTTKSGIKGWLMVANDYCQEIGVACTKYQLSFVADGVEGPNGPYGLVITLENIPLEQLEEQKVAFPKILETITYQK